MITFLLYPHTRCFTSCFHYYHFCFIALFFIETLNGRTINTLYRFGCVGMERNGRLSSWQKALKILFRYTTVTLDICAPLKKTCHTKTKRSASTFELHFRLQQFGFLVAQSIYHQTLQLLLHSQF